MEEHEEQESMSAPQQEARPTEESGQEAREAEILRREKAVAQRELRAWAREALAQRKLPAEFMEVVNYTDAAACEASVQTLEAAFSQAVKQAVENKLHAEPAPRVGADKGCVRTLKEAIRAHYTR